MMDFSQTCLPLYGVFILLQRVACLCRMILLWGSYSFERVEGLGRVILPVSHLSPTVSQYALGTLGRIISAVASPSRCCAPHDAYMCLLLSCFALFPNTYLSSTCLPPVAALDGRIWLVSRLFPISVCVAAGLGRKTSFASAFLPLVSHCCSCPGVALGRTNSLCLLVVFCLCFCAVPGMEEFHLVTTCLPFSLLLSHFCLRLVFGLPLFLICFFHLRSHGGQQFNAGIFFFGGTFSSNLLMTLIHQGWWAQSNGPS